MYTNANDRLVGVWQTPTGAVALAHWMLHQERNFAEPSNFLGFPFLSVPGQQRWAMDLFAFWPQPGFVGEPVNADACTHDFGMCGLDSSWSVWRNATRWCLLGFAPGERLPSINASRQGQRADFSPIPEMLLNEVRERFGLRFRVFPGGGGYQYSYLKDQATHPALGWPKRVPQSLWHSHNATAVELWLQQRASQSSQRRLVSRQL